MNTDTIRNLAIAALCIVIGYVILGKPPVAINATPVEDKVQVQPVMVQPTAKPAIIRVEKPAEVIQQPAPMIQPAAPPPTNEPIIYAEGAPPANEETDVNYFTDTEGNWCVAATKPNGERHTACGMLSKDDARTVAREIQEGKYTSHFAPKG